MPRLKAARYEDGVIKRVIPPLVLWLATAALVWAQVPSAVTPQTHLLPMRDGVRLATDVFLPPEGPPPPYPVVLVRTPYDKKGIGTAGMNAAKLGYAVVVQDTRGRFGSEGENLPFDIDDRDGYDTVQWIVRQGWCNGKIGTFGGSAVGITQLQLAGTGYPLACQHITVAAPNLYADVVYTGGIFRKALVDDWLRISKFSPRALELWSGHDGYDQYWRARDVSRRFRQVNAPALHIGGFYDIFAQGTIDAFVGYQTKGGPRARGRQKLLMGPWSHGVLTEKVGDLVFPNAKRPPNDVHDHVRWWERHLKGVDNGVDSLPAVTYYVMGDVTDPAAPGNVWRTADQWPPVQTKKVRWYLHPDETLSQDRPAGASATVTYRYDPNQPVPTLGGYQLTIPAGPRDQRSIESRPDVLVFTSETLAQPLEVTGRIRAKLYVSSDCPDTDFVVRVCDVYPDGRSINVTEGALRARYRNSLEREDFLKPGRLYGLEIDLWSTSIIFNRGHRVRVHVTSSSSPGYDPNPNTEEPLRWSNRKVVASNTIYVARPFASHIELPVARAEEQAGASQVDSQMPHGAIDIELASIIIRP